jgi:ribosomal protein L35
MYVLGQLVHFEAVLEHVLQEMSHADKRDQKKKKIQYDKNEFKRRKI